MSPEERQHIATLERRAWFLERRIDWSTIELTHDQHEAQALQWACATLRGFLGEAEAPMPSATGAARVGGPLAP